MSKPVIDVAKSLLKKRQFGQAIVVLEGARDIYHQSFEYYLTLGIACLYAGDVGNSNRYFQQARHIKIRDVRLLLGQAALYLRRGDTDLAIQYYLEVQELDPENPQAKAAMDFIQNHSDYDEIVKIVDSGKIEKFFPPVGKSYSKVIRIACSAVAGVVIALIILHCVNLKSDGVKGKRADLSDLTLSVEELSNLQEKDLSGGVYRYILNDKQIIEAYDQAKLLFQDFRDNSARVQINRLLNSNASSSLKSKANLLLTYFEEPTFDSLTDNFDYADVAADPSLYIGCWVAWSGRISNARVQEDIYSCDLLIGYENLERVDGIVPVYFTPVPVPEIEGDRAVKILAKIGIENGKMALYGRSVFQPMRKNTEN